MDSRRAAAQRLFWNREEHRLRAPWRLVLQALLLVGLALLPILLIAEPLTSLHKRGLFLASLDKEHYDRVINIIVGPIMTIAVMASVWLAGRWLDHRQMRDFGLRISCRWWKDLMFGLVLGAVLMTLLFLAEYWAGWISITGTLQPHVPGISLSLAGLFALTKDLCVGIYEETVARGYQVTNLAEGLTGVARLGRRGALVVSVALTSVIFSALHGFNENSSFQSTANLALIGAMFAIGYVTTGELALPMGLHMSWNFFQGTIFGFAVSGHQEAASVIAIRQAGPTLLTGGAFGPEAGVAGSAIAVLGIGLIVVWSRRQHPGASLFRLESPWMHPTNP